MVRETVSVIGMLMLVAGSAAAQDAQGQTSVTVPTLRTQTQDAQGIQSKEVQGTQSSDVRRAQTAAGMRKQALIFSDALQRAVVSGAEMMVDKARQVAPDAAGFFSGPTEVSFYRLPNSGPVFDVRVPGMTTNASWALAILLSPQQNGRPRSVPQSNQSGGVRPTALLPDGSAPTPTPYVDSVLSEPAAVYTREIRTALVDAMIENSGALQISSGDWLTVVARGNSSTSVFQIKGSDLNEIREKQIPLEEARKKVRVSED